MINVECFYTNGDSITTKFNGTFHEAYNYFVGKIFNIGTTKDNIQECINIKYKGECNKWLNTKETKNSRNISKTNSTTERLSQKCR